MSQATRPESSTAEVIQAPNRDDDTPMVSVVIPVRNDGRRLEVCLASLRSQTYPADRFEVIVIDNGSTDDSAAVAQRAGVTLLKAPGLRVGAVRNRGVQASRGTIVAFVDSDHELPTHWLASGVAELNKDIGISAVGCAYQAPPTGTWVQRTWEIHRLRRVEDPDALWLGAGNLFVRRADFEAVGGFREDLIATEDTDLCFRLRDRGKRIASTRRVINIHHGEPINLRHFFRKELWRGASNLRAFLDHGAPVREWLSILYPLHHLVFVVLAVVGIVVGCVRQSWWLEAGSLVLLLTPSLLLAFRTARTTRRWSAVPALGVLYLTYGIARSAALFRGFRRPKPGSPR